MTCHDISDISRMPECTLISTATSSNMSHARLMAYSSLASICKTKMVHEMLLMLPNHFVITNILRNHLETTMFNFHDMSNSYLRNASVHAHQYSNIIQYVTCKAHGLFIFGKYLQDQNGLMKCFSCTLQSFQQHQPICHMHGLPNSSLASIWRPTMLPIISW